MNRFIRVCSWCNKLCIDGKWAQIPIPVETKNITHGICPTCKDKEFDNGHSQTSVFKLDRK
jgi:hypothetical protein